MREMQVRQMSPERRSALLVSRPVVKPEKPTKYARLSDGQILELDLDASLSKEDQAAVAVEMSKRNLYGN